MQADHILGQAMQKMNESALKKARVIALIDSWRASTVGVYIGNEHMAPAVVVIELADLEKQLGVTGEDAVRSQLQPIAEEQKFSFKFTALTKTTSVDIWPSPSLPPSSLAKNKAVGSGSAKFVAPKGPSSWTSLRIIPILPKSPTAKNDK